MYGVVYNAADGDLELSQYANVFNISASSFVQSFSVNAEQTSPNGLTFSTDGLRMFVCGYTGTKINSYTLTTAFDVSTASSEATYNFSAQEALPGGIFFKPDGTRLFMAGRNGQDINEYSLSAAFDISTIAYVRNFSVSAQDTTPRDVGFNTDGSKMFVLGSDGNDINEYALSANYDISTAVYTRNFVFTTQDTGAFGFAFNTDGTKMFMVGQTNDKVYRYNLTTGYDVSTAVYFDDFLVSAQDITPTSIAFSASGGSLFVLGDANNSVYKYTSGDFSIPTGYQPVHTTASIDSTYWTDINSMTADQNAGDGNVYYAISTDDRTTWTVIDNTDGERDIVRNNAGTWQYNSNGTYASETWTAGATNTELATLAEAMEGAAAVVNGFDVSTASFTDSFSVAGQETAPQGLAFNTDGTKMFVVGTAGDDVNEYTLSTGFDVSTASFVDSFSIASQETTPLGLTFNTDGSKMFVVGFDGKAVSEYDLSTGFDVSTASYSQNFSVSAQDTAPSAIAFNTDGTKMFIVGETGQDVNEYTLSTGFDVSTSTFVDSFSVAAQETGPQGIAFNTDGTKMFICGYTGQDVNEYTLSTGFDVSTASYSQVFSVSAQDTVPRSLAFNTSGTKMFVLGDTGNAVYEYSVGTTSYINQMDKTQLDAVTDPNHIALGNDLDLAIVFNLTSGTTVPSSDGVAINYDANVLNKGAVLGTEYDFDAPTQSSVRITALAGNNLKVRVV
jgi:hypothetical protein